MSYQSFEGKRGASRSEEKLKALKLPELKGKRFLDIGCNAGFFCLNALNKGASRVVGVEMSKAFADDAVRNCPGAVILNQSWDTLPLEKFDVIQMSSAMHYEPQPRDLARRIYDRLSPEGIFVFEGGILMDEGERWVEVPRPAGSTFYPTWPLLRDRIFADFAVRLIGTSVNQSGDPLQRYVVHCTRKEPTFIILSGASRKGKSVLARDISGNNVASYETDILLLKQKVSKFRTSDDVFNEYIVKIDSEKINTWVDDINDDGLAKSVAQFLFRTSPKEAGIVVLEGYVFTNSLVVHHFVKEAESAACRVWGAGRLTSGESTYTNGLGG